MPLYAFRCTSCGHEFDRLLSLRHDPETERCPTCGEPVRRLITSFATGSDRRDTPAATPAGGG